MQDRKVMVKLRVAADASQTSKRIAKRTASKGVRQIRPLFPEEVESDLATLYEFDLAPDASASDVLKELQNDEDVEYAHLPAERTPKP
jgi:hypothetical protein